MTESPFFTFYASELQQAYALWVVPLLFLAYLLSAGRHRAKASTDPAAGFLWTYALVFTVETLLDSFSTSLLAKWLGVAGTSVGTAWMVAFVLLGDWRVFVLVLRLARPRTRWLRDATLWTLLVPLAALAVESGLRRRWPELPEQTIWLVYELAFLAVAVVLRTLLVPRWTAREAPERAPLLRAVLGYVATYYGLWALSDALVMVFDLDAGWALRVVPNQLYYSFWTPFVFWFFFRERARDSAASAAS